MNQLQKIENLLDVFKIVLKNKIEFIIYIILTFLIIFLFNFYNKSNYYNEKFEVTILRDSPEVKVFDFGTIEKVDEIQKFFNFEKFSYDKLDFIEINKIEEDIISEELQLIEMYNIHKTYTQKKYSIYQIIKKNFGLKIFDIFSEKNSMIKIDNVEKNNFSEQFLITLENNSDEDYLSNELKKYINYLHDLYIKEIIDFKYDNYKKFENYLKYSFDKFKRDLTETMKDYNSILITEKILINEKIIDKQNLYTKAEKNSLILHLKDIERMLAGNKNTFAKIENSDFCEIIKEYYQAQIPVNKIEYIKNRNICLKFKSKINLNTQLKEKILQLKNDNFVRNDFKVIVKKINLKSFNVFNIISYLVISFFISTLIIIIRELFAFNKSEKN